MKQFFTTARFVCSVGLTIFSTVLSAQNVGIGTTTPTQFFHVARSGQGITQEDTATHIQVGFYTAGSGAYVQTYSKHNLRFATGNGSSDIVLDTLHNVGIGYSPNNPISKLHVLGTQVLRDSLSIGSNILPKATLDVTGKFRLKDGQEASGKVLTCGTDGVAGWSTMPEATLTLPYTGISNTNAAAFRIVSGAAGNGAIYAEISNPNSTGNAFSASTQGQGASIYAFQSGTGGVLHLRHFNFNTTAPTMTVERSSSGDGINMTINAGVGNFAVFKRASETTARISVAGGGYFNGGTFSSGADVAETFSVEGERNSYEPGDVLEISLTTDRTVIKSSTPYSKLVSGVYATKPGVTLSERAVTESIDDMVPMGVIGVIPTKVCTEGGAIHRGDLLVTSSTTGCAMKGDDDKIKIGMVLGKALEDFNGAGVGLIKVLVSMK